MRKQNANLNARSPMSNRIRQNNNSQQRRNQSRLTQQSGLSNRKASQERTDQIRPVQQKKVVTKLIQKPKTPPSAELEYEAFALKLGESINKYQNDLAELQQHYIEIQNCKQLMKQDEQQRTNDIIEIEEIRQLWETEKCIIIGQNQITDDIIQLNIEGTLKSVDKSVLTKIQGSKLAQMFSGKHQLKKIDGAYFIDRDITIFSYVISYLRNNLQITDFEDKFVRHQFELELKYWGLHQAYLDQNTRYFHNLVNIFEVEPTNCNQKLIAKWCQLGALSLESMIQQNKFKIDRTLAIDYGQDYNGQISKDLQKYGIGRHITADQIFEGSYQGVRNGWGRLIYIDNSASTVSPQKQAETSKNASPKKNAVSKPPERRRGTLNKQSKMLKQNQNQVKKEASPILVYEGNFESDKKHGYGILTKSDGEQIEGQWENDTLQKQEESQVLQQLSKFIKGAMF